MTATLTPLAAIGLLGLISDLPFQPIEDSGEAAYWADAGPGALITYAYGDEAAKLAEFVMPAADLSSGLAVIIGGDALQVEIHGIAGDGDPLSWTLPIPNIEGAA